MTRDWGGQAQRLTARRPKTVTFRRVTRTSGPQPAINPPSTGALLVNGLTLAGAVTIGLRATTVTGFLKAGDSFVIAGDATVYTVGGNVTAVTNAFAAVAISPALAAQAADGAAVTVTFAADQDVEAAVGPYPVALRNGTTILNSDLRVVVPAPNLAGADPTPLDLLIIDGVKRAIKAVAPAIADETAFWELQAQ